MIQMEHRYDERPVGLLPWLRIITIKADKDINPVEDKHAGGKGRKDFGSDLERIGGHYAIDYKYYLRGSCILQRAAACGHGGSERSYRC